MALVGRWIVIDANKPIEDIEREIRNLLQGGGAFPFMVALGL